MKRRPGYVDELTLTLVKDSLAIEISILQVLGLLGKHLDLIYLKAFLNEKKSHYMRSWDLLCLPTKQGNWFKNEFMLP